MSAITVSVDGNTLATVPTDKYHVMSVRVSSTKVDEMFAILEVNGGIYPEGEPSIFLIWVNEYPLTVGQTVLVSFVESSSTSHQGKTIEELFPSSSETESHKDQSLNEIIEELRRSPRLHDNFAFNVRSSNGAAYSGATTSIDHGFGFMVLWNWLRPERVSASLHTYTLDDLAENRLPNNHIREYITVGGSVSIEFVS